MSGHRKQAYILRWSLLGECRSKQLFCAPYALHAIHDCSDPSLVTQKKMILYAVTKLKCLSAHGNLHCANDIVPVLFEPAVEEKTPRNDL